VQRFVGLGVLFMGVCDFIERYMWGVRWAM
jgi:hypothetical protein